MTGRFWIGSFIVWFTVPIVCGCSSSPEKTTAGTADSSATGGGSGTSSTGGATGASGASGVPSTGGMSGTGGARGTGGANSGLLDGGSFHAGTDAGSSCVPGGPCKLSVGPCHIGTVICDSVGIGWCQDDGPATDGTHCGVHGTCTAGSCVETTACNVSYNCPAGQTCWTKDGAWFDCMVDGAGKPGDSCEPSTFAAITCGDHLACLGTTNLPGHCVAWCNPDPCPSGKTCTSVTTTKNVTLQFCL